MRQPRLRRGQAQSLTNKSGVHAKPIERLSSMSTTAPFAVSQSWKTTDTLVRSTSTLITRAKGSPQRFWPKWRRKPSRVATCLSTEASITAQPFFAKHSFETVAAQDVDYRGQTFRNYRMRKNLVCQC